MIPVFLSPPPMPWESFCVIKTVIVWKVWDSIKSLSCSSYNWFYKFRFFKLCLKSEFQFLTRQGLSPSSPSPLLAPLSSRVPMLIRLMRYNLMIFISICLLTAEWCRESEVWGWHSLHYFSSSPPVSDCVLSLAACDHCDDILASCECEDGAGVRRGDMFSRMKVLQGRDPAFTAFHHKLNVYTALLSPPSLDLSQWVGLFCF